MPHGGWRPGAGRKPTGLPQRKIHAVKFTDEEWALVRQYAKQAGIKSASEYIRKRALQQF